MPFPSIHNPHGSRRGAVMIYALVFAITAAVTLYVASSIYQARQKANALRAYSEQRMVLNWNFQHIMRASQQNSLDGGYGLTDIDSWNQFTEAPVSAYTYKQWAGVNADMRKNTDSGQTAGDMFAAFRDYDAVLWENVGSLAHFQNSFFNGGVLVDASNNSRIDMTSPLHIGQEFTASDMFTVPGWKPRRHATPITETGLSTAVSPHEPNEANQNFLLVTGSSPLFPNELRWRTDLPFDTSNFFLTPNSYELGQTQYLRWIRDGLSGTLRPQNIAMQSITGQVPVASYTWAVEEPITNYQLLLLDPFTGSWPGANISGNIKITDSLLNNVVNRPKILIHGPVDNGFYTTVHGGFLTGRDGGSATPNLVPLAMVIHGSVDDAVLSAVPTASDGFEWRVAKPSTQLSFGRRMTALGNLGLFLTTEPFSNFNSSANADDERQLEIVNAQASIMPPFTATASALWFCYLNSVLSMSDDGKVKWSAQTAVPATGGTMGPTYQLMPFGTTGSGGADYWVYKDPSVFPPNTLYNPGVPAEKPSQVELKYGNITAPSNTFDNYTGAAAGALGLSAVHYYATGFSATIVTVDLSKVGIQQLTAAGDIGMPPQTPAWESPIEVNIHNDAPTSSRLLYVKIKGDATPMAGNKQPVRIVVRGAEQVRLVPDNSGTAIAGVGNYRRFILTTTDNAHPLRLALETAGSSYRWYGVIIAPFGLTVNSFTNMSITGTTPSPGTPNGATLLWQGTILVRNSLIVGQFGGALQISPDDGDQTSSGLASDPAACAYAFTPKYNGNLPLGRPVPLMVPRMVWTFE